MWCCAFWDAKSCWKMRAVIKMPALSNSRRSFVSTSLDKHLNVCRENSTRTLTFPLFPWNKHTLKVKPNVTSAVLIIRLIFEILKTFPWGADLWIISTPRFSHAHCSSTWCHRRAMQSDSRRASTPYMLPNKTRWFRVTDDLEKDNGCLLHFVILYMPLQAPRL